MSAPSKRQNFLVKLSYQDRIQRIEGTRADEPAGPGTLAVYNDVDIAARFSSDVEGWWPEAAEPTIELQEES